MREFLLQVSLVAPKSTLPEMGILSLGFSGRLELSPSVASTPCTENLTGALHAEATGCRLAVNGIIKSEIRPGNHLTVGGQGMKLRSTPSIGRVPGQIDFTDFRNVGKVKLALRLLHAWLERCDSIVLSEIHGSLLSNLANFDSPVPLKR